MIRLFSFHFLYKAAYLKCYSNAASYLGGFLARIVDPQVQSLGQAGNIIISVTQHFGRVFFFLIFHIYFISCRCEIWQLYSVTSCGSPWVRASAIECSSPVLTVYSEKLLLLIIAFLEPEFVL